MDEAAGRTQERGEVGRRNPAPRNRRKLVHAVSAEGYDPLCGDHCTVYLDIGDGLVRDIGFQGTGCAILLASASLMTLAVSGKTLDGARAVAERFVALVTSSSPPDGDDLGDLAVMAGVRDYPGRVKCATLPWHALRAAIEGS